MNHEQHRVILGTLIVIGIALLVYASSKGKSRLPIWVLWPAVIPYVACGVLYLLLDGLAIVIGWPIRRLGGSERLHKWRTTADVIVGWVWLIGTAVSIVGGPLWLIVQFVRSV